jgi:CheY-like chemotaxis protein
LAADPFHVIFLDINLPDFTGHQLLIAIRSIELGFPRSMRARIFITTASADQAEVLKAYLKRCDGYIIKPIDPQLFRNQMTECGIH